MLAQRLRGWPSINPALGQRFIRCEWSDSGRTLESGSMITKSRRGINPDKGKGDGSVPAQCWDSAGDSEPAMDQDPER